MSRNLPVLGILSSLLGLAALASAQAQPPPAAPAAAEAPKRPTAGPLTVHPLTSTVYWVSGGIGNTGFIVGDTGVVVVDTTISPSGGKELLADIAKVTPKPVVAVILTHGDTDHTGGLSAFPAGIQIIAQANTLTGMQAATASGRSQVPADHLPNHTVADRETMQLGGVTVQLLHWAPAHTAGDLVIYLPAQKIVFTGDIFAADQPRALIHLEQHGSSEGWITSAKGVAALDADRFVIGHGDVWDKASVQKRIALVIAERAQIKQLVAKGETLAQIQSEVGDPPPGQPAAAPGTPHFTPFSEAVYQELSGKSQ